MKNYTILFLLLTMNVSAQKIFESRPNYNYATNPLFTGVDMSENPGGWEFFKKLVTLSTNTEMITLDILDDEVVSFDVDISFIENTVTILEGSSSSRNYPNATIHLEDNGNEMIGHIKLTDTYLLGISTIGNDFYVLYRMLSLANNDCSTVSYSFPKTKEENVGLQAESSSTNDENDTGLTVYRMILAYTPQFAATFSEPNRQQKINDFLIGVEESINEVYINSGNNVRARLVFSYKTTDNETGNKDDDLKDFEWFHRVKYNEIFTYRNRYKADVLILLVAETYGGKASRTSNMGVYAKNGANYSLYTNGTPALRKNYGVAHEIGHMFDLEHNREEFLGTLEGWWKRKVNGTSWALDNKKAYGYQGTTYKTVMSYGSQIREPLHADSGFTFPIPDGTAAGDSWSKARNFLNSHNSNVITYSDNYI